MCKVELQKTCSTTNILIKTSIMKYPIHLLKVINLLRKLPGVGTKSAERFAFELIQWQPHELKLFGETLSAIPEEIQLCVECGSLSNANACLLCTRAVESPITLCVVGMPRDVFAIEATREYKGLYHVLGSLLSPLNGIGPEKLNISKLKERIRTRSISEVVIALDSTLEGDATSLYLKEELISLNVQVSRLAFGLPMGSSLDYVDGGTLARAFTARGRF
jgi:recombination protein RecR